MNDLSDKFAPQKENVGEILRVDSRSNALVALLNEKAVVTRRLSASNVIIEVLAWENGIGALKKLPGEEGYRSTSASCYYHWEAQYKSLDQQLREHGL